mmetsp:Transcript_45686/g.97365  ORF Transcript_45686/g.97365 Transcript_45686/m.97365 type:complete len:272 (-) Transcript_45686:315-1130(-)
MRTNHGDGTAEEVRLLLDVHGFVRRVLAIVEHERNIAQPMLLHCRPDQSDHVIGVLLAHWPAAREAAAHVKDDDQIVPYLACLLVLTFRHKAGHLACHHALLLHPRAKQVRVLRHIRPHSTTLRRPRLPWRTRTYPSVSLGRDDQAGISRTDNRTDAGKLAVLLCLRILQLGRFGPEDTLCEKGRIDQAEDVDHGHAKLSGSIYARGVEREQQLRVVAHDRADPRDRGHVVVQHVAVIRAERVVEGIEGLRDLSPTWEVAQLSRVLPPAVR